MVQVGVRVGVHGGPSGWELRGFSLALLPIDPLPKEAGLFLSPLFPQL